MNKGILKVILGANLNKAAFVLCVDILAHIKTQKPLIPIPKLDSQLLPTAESLYSESNSDFGNGNILCLRALRFINKIGKIEDKKELFQAAFDYLHHMRLILLEDKNPFRDNILIPTEELLKQYQQTELS